ncbi:IclR family transcriptional regulator [Phytoactinopolyspora halotolerans]|uniref:Glycerol operon regulatory protein n=1 Tax=Phytoactinopolyspora halotolerans TaxID=1981512 RepID=A0A6L9SEN3_9ACTN|nr:IclR family transcriptional regulator [Phytoactinopolyspora halotolerans]NEE02941.1 IclR family transcriptional regulator [Phytoactinopolyspora halotolerans]
MGSRNTRPPRSLVSKTLDVLDAFSPEHPALTLSDISSRSGLPLTTTHRIVKDLTAWGALERNDDGRYHIGLHLWEVAALAPRGLGLREVALPYMEDLYGVTQENVQLAVRENVELVFVERLTGRHAVPVRTRVGGRFALHATGVGLVLLAFAPHDVQEQILASPLESWTEKTIADPEMLRRVLADVRRTGIAVSDRQVTMDAVSVAAPILGADDGVVAALSVVVHADDADPVALAPAVRTAARGISRALGSPSARRRPDSPIPR